MKTQVFCQPAMNSFRRTMLTLGSMAHRSTSSSTSVKKRLKRGESGLFLVHLSFKEMLKEDSGAFSQRKENRPVVERKRMHDGI
jgi:hypothetical protein